MSNQTSHHILLIGLPASGKTTFLAALWYMVDQSAVNCALHLDKLDGDSKYLNQIRDAWLEYQPVPRNTVDTETLVSMTLKHDETQSVVRLTFPDLSGESFQLQWSKRQLPTAYDKLLRQATGGILFVHPDRIKKPHRIDSLIELAEMIPDASSEQGTPISASTEVLPWDPEKSPTQVQLVELLQIMSGRDHFSPPFRLAIAVSAWDLLGGLHTNPTNYVSNELPLLSQFLRANQDLFTVEIYGVSAQGGPYASPLLGSEHFTDLNSLATRLCRDPDAPSTWLWQQLDRDTQNALQTLSSGSQVPSGLRSSLVANFNALISGLLIYDEARFSAVKIRSETKDLLNRVLLRTLQNETMIAPLNRLLLEDAYPTEISKQWKFQNEQTNLQNQFPARRVSVVGGNLPNPHDLTGPIQWAMR